MQRIHVVNRITWILLILSCVIQLSCSRILATNDTNFIQISQKRKSCDPSYEFHCRNGECIDNLYFCDGIKDCRDGSDETDETCAGITCAHYLYKCAYGACVNKNARCNGIIECADESDEAGCISVSIGDSTVRKRRQATCEYRCGSGECLDNEFLCDGSTDCTDGSDETKAACGNIRCQSYLFRCKYGACIAKNKVCDGERNCADNSDEETPGCASTPTLGTCKNFEFRCHNGNCIDNLDICDGIKHCSDGSDETEETCSGLVCHDYLYRCAYGACVAKSSRCNGKIECVDGSDEAGCPGASTPTTPPPPTPTPPVQTGTDCLLPHHLANGVYTLGSQKPYVENTYTRSSSAIRLTCNEGYISSQIENFYCYEAKWYPALSLGFCKGVCRPLPSTDTYDATCNKGPCENSENGTVAKIVCKPYYVYRATRVNPKCESGAWNPHPTPCEPECGQKIVNAQELVVNGTDALPGEYPWIAGIYNTSMNKETHICGATIISRFYLVTAAHCLADQGGTVYPENYFTIAAGKYYRALNISEAGVQIRKIVRIYVHEDYRGRWQKYRDDIALIEVASLEMTPTVQIICIDWSSKYEEQDFQENKKAVVVGWGFTQEGATPAEVLKKLVVPYRSTDICRQFMDPDFFQQYYSSDKICAGYKDEGKSVCSGDSGGGLYFRSQETSFYIRGVVSLAPRSEVGCDSNHYALYTKVSKYLFWVEGITRKKL